MLRVELNLLDQVAFFLADDLLILQVGVMTPKVSWECSFEQLWIECLKPIQLDCLGFFSGVLGLVVILKIGNLLLKTLCQAFNDSTSVDIVYMLA